MKLGTPRISVDDLMNWVMLNIPESGMADVAIGYFPGSKKKADELAKFIRKAVNDFEFSTARGTTDGN